MSFSVPVVAHNEFNGGVGSHPDLETLQEKRLRLINDRYDKAMLALDLKFQPLIDEFGSSGSIKEQQLIIRTYELLRDRTTYRYKEKIKRINDRDGKRIEERDGKRLKDLKKKIKKKLGK